MSSNSLALEPSISEKCALDDKPTHGGNPTSDGNDAQKSRPPQAISRWDLFRAWAVSSFVGVEYLNMEIETRSSIVLPIHKNVFLPPLLAYLECFHLTLINRTHRYLFSKTLISLPSVSWRMHAIISNVFFSAFRMIVPYHPFFF